MVFKMAVLISLSFCAAQATTKPPNFLFVLADDFGHYDVGWRNPEVTSPTLDALATSGIILNRHYVYKYCRYVASLSTSCAVAHKISPRKSPERPLHVYVVSCVGTLPSSIQNFSPRKFPCC